MLGTQSSSLRPLAPGNFLENSDRLNLLLNDTPMAARLQRISREMQAEPGARRAAEAVMAAIDVSH